MTDTIIVGAGICGLQLAALLASDGQEVLVLEKQSRPGGRAYIWEKDGFKVDNGVHLVRFGPKSATARVFRKIGAPLDFKPLGKSYVAFPDGGVCDFPTSPGGFLTTKMMTIGERFKTLGIMIKLRSQDPSALYETSVKDWMDGLGLSGGVRDYLRLVSASMQVCPFIERSSAGEMLENMKAVLAKGYSAMYPVQGWPYIYGRLFEAIAKSGEVRSSSPVKRVIIEDGAARGVEMESGETIEAARVVVSLPSRHIFEVIGESAVPADFARLCKEQTPTSGVVLDYGLEKKVSGDSGLWYFTDPMSFGLFTSNLCPETAPPGKQLLTWLAPLDFAEMGDESMVKSVEERLEKAIFGRFPGLEDAVEWRRALHLRMVDGVEVNVRQHRGKRPGYRVPGVESLFLVGDSLKGPGAGGDVGHESVLECYEEMTGQKA